MGLGGGLGGGNGAGGAVGLEGQLSRKDRDKGLGQIRGRELHLPALSTFETQVRAPCCVGNSALAFLCLLLLLH